MLPTERCVYSAIRDRPRLTLPGSARLAVWVIVMSRNGIRARRCRGQFSRRPRAVRRCRTCRIGPGTNTVTGSDFGACLRSLIA